jgi:orotidine-5'-phosphate decarboxylase
MRAAQQLDYYVLLDAPEVLSARSAEAAAQKLSDWPCDGIVISAYVGSDGIKAYLPVLEQKEKSLFVVLRTGNKSASELQDLMTGSRLVYMAAADIVSRLAEANIGKSGYWQLAGVGAANAPEALRTLRSKYNRLFLLLDGYDYSNANARSCSYAFDQFGHGAAACAGDSVTAAWKQTPGDGSRFAADAAEAAMRMQKNLLRYITVL